VLLAGPCPAVLMRKCIGRGSRYNATPMRQWDEQMERAEQHCADATVRWHNNYSGGTKVSTQTPHMQRVCVASHFPPTPTYFAAFLDKHTIKCIPRNWNILLTRGPELLRDGNWAYQKRRCG